MIVRQRFLEQDAVAGSRDGNQQIVAVRLAYDNIRSGDTNTKQQSVGSAGRANVQTVFDGVLTIAKIEDESIIPFTTIKQIVAEAADQSVISILTIELVIARASGHHVAAIAAVEDVIAICACNGKGNNVIVRKDGTVSKLDAFDAIMIIAQRLFQQHTIRRTGDGD